MKHLIRGNIKVPTIAVLNIILLRADEIGINVNADIYSIKQESFCNVIEVTFESAEDKLLYVLTHGCEITLDDYAMYAAGAVAGA